MAHVMSFQFKMFVWDISVKFVLQLLTNRQKENCTPVTSDFLNVHKHINYFLKVSKKDNT